MVVVRGDGALRAGPGAGARRAMTAGDLTLLYSFYDTEHNNAVALRRYLLARRETGSSPDQEAGG